jgi:hypothetical protein
VSRNYIERIKTALGPERAMIFMETVNALDLNPDDPELLLAAANASFVVSLAEIPKLIASEREKLEGVFARFLQDVDLKIAEGMTKAVDEMHTEVRTMARELAQGEYTAAASLRSTAIMDEVRALKGAANELERERLAADARGIAVGGSGPEGGPANVRGGGGLTPRTFVVFAVILVVGVLVGAFLTKRTYDGWRPPARHVAVVLQRQAAFSAAQMRGKVCARISDAKPRLSRT